MLLVLATMIVRSMSEPPSADRSAAATRRARRSARCRARHSATYTTTSASDHFASACSSCVFPVPKPPGTVAAPPRATGKSVSITRWPVISGAPGSSRRATGQRLPHRRAAQHGHGALVDPREWFLDRARSRPHARRDAGQVLGDEDAVLEGGRLLNRSQHVAARDGLSLPDGRRELPRACAVEGGKPRSARDERTPEESPSAPPARGAAAGCRRRCCRGGRGPAPPPAASPCRRPARRPAGPRGVVHLNDDGAGVRAGSPRPGASPRPRERGHYGTRSLSPVAVTTGTPAIRLTWPLSGSGITRAPGARM